jgi:hypothetical protein
MTPWQDVALLRPGQEVVLLNMSRGGALLESATRMMPGARTVLHLFGATRRVVRGRIDRCHVARLDPLRYVGAVVFDHDVEWRVDEGVVGSRRTAP